MANPLQQTIEALAKEKGIEPDVVITAIEEAVATASRKYYRTGENLKTRFNTETGQVDLAQGNDVEAFDVPVVNAFFRAKIARDIVHRNFPARDTGRGIHKPQRAFRFQAIGRNHRRAKEYQDSH